MGPGPDASTAMGRDAATTTGPDAAATMGPDAATPTGPDATTSMEPDAATTTGHDAATPCLNQTREPEAGSMSENDDGPQKPNLLSLAGPSFSAAMLRSVRLGGQSGLLLRLLLSNLTKQASGQCRQ